VTSVSFHLELVFVLDEVWLTSNCNVSSKSSILLFQESTRSSVILLYMIINSESSVQYVVVNHS